MVAYTAKGAAARLFNSRDEVCLVEGPAGTGKSLAACWYIHACAMKHPIRVLMARKTRKSLTDSSMTTFENAVLANDPTGRRIMGKAHKGNRDRYQYPNGSEIVCAGFDDPQKVLSSEYDLIYVEQAEQCLLGDIEIALSRLRNNSGYEPKQMILVANPGHPAHYLMQWARAGKAAWFSSKIQDNPLYWDEINWRLTDAGERYMSKLSRLSGVNYRRYVLGEWCGEEGQILRYDPRTQIVRARLEHESSGWWLNFEDRKRTRLDWFVVGVDWGNTAPGSLVVIGFDRDRKGYVVEHYYKSKQTTDWWANVAERMWRKYEPVAYICDDAEPDRITIFNDRLGHHYGRDVGAPAIGAHKYNALLTGIAELQEALDNDELYFLADSLANEPDPEIQEGQPRSLIEEVDQWIWLVDKQTGISIDRPDPRRRDDAIDAMRYAWMWARNRDYANRTPPTPRSMRALLEEHSIGA